MAKYHQADTINNSAEFYTQHLQNISEQYSVCGVLQYGFQCMLLSTYLPLLIPQQKQADLGNV